MVQYLLYLLLVTSVHCICSNGYADIGNGNCYKTFTTSSLRREAERFCEQQGGHLVQPLNAFVNAQIRMEVQKLNTDIWLGITCTGTTKTSCTFSNGDHVTATSYTNFAPGHPHPENGKCIYLARTGSLSGKWISGVCEQRSIGFGCQLASIASSCGSSYSEFDDYCYKTIAPTSEPEAESNCEVECGYLTSIHSKEDNEFIRKLAVRTQPDALFTRIGLRLSPSGQYDWIDGTASPHNSYNDFGFSDPASGICVNMDLYGQSARIGQWSNDECNNKLTSVCKRAKTNPCTSFSVPSTVAPNTTLAPPTCPAVYDLKGNGTIYSPGFPSDYDKGLRCEYDIMASEGSVVFFALNTHEYEDYVYSSISLYNNLTTTEPFIRSVEVGILDGNTSYASSSPAMKVIFNSGTYGLYKWSASYKAVDMRPSGCNRGILKASGIITSPDFPNPYPSKYSCNYQLQADTGKRIFLQFSQFHTEENSDFLYVYDGPNSKAALLKTYSGDLGSSISNITSSTNLLFVSFTSDLSNAYSGFTASFSYV